MYCLNDCILCSASAVNERSLDVSRGLEPLLLQKCVTVNVRCLTLAEWKVNYITVVVTFCFKEDEWLSYFHRSIKPVCSREGRRAVLQGLWKNQGH